MKTLNKYLEQFEAHHNGDMSPGEVEVFMQSLEQDGEMLTAWNEYMDMMKALSDKEAVSLRKKLEGAFYQQQDNKIRFISQNLWFRISAAAVVIVVMGALLYLFCSNNQNFFRLEDDSMLVEANSTEAIEVGAPEIVQIDSINIIEEAPGQINPEMQIASIYEKEQYQISPVFAELLHSVYRSGWFKINTPEDSALFSPGDSLVFSWETNIEELMFFDILDRNGLVIYKHPEPISSPWVYLPNLSPAIYMYRFATEEEPVWMGVVVGE